MRRRRATSRNPAKSKQRTKAKGGAAPKAAPNRRLSASSKDTEVARLTRERDDAVDQLSAASEVLRVISRSPDELDPVFTRACPQLVDSQASDCVIHGRSA